MITFLTYNYVCVCVCVFLLPTKHVSFHRFMIDILISVSLYDSTTICLCLWIYIIYVCLFKVLRMLDDCMKLFLIGAMWNNTVKYLRFEVFITRYILNSTPSLISWSVNYVFNILKFNKKNSWTRCLGIVSYIYYVIYACNWWVD